MTEVAKVNGTTLTTYSNDNAVHEGMELKDAYSDKALFEKFKQADVNGDGKISAQEINRYNGPVLYGQFYPGLKLDNVSNDNVSTFREIDFNKDGVIEKDEIDLKTKKDKILEEADNKIYLNDHVFGATCGASIATGAAALLLMVMAGALIPVLIIGAIAGGAVAAGSYYAGNCIHKNIEKNTQNELTKLDNEYKNKKTVTQIQSSPYEDKTAIKTINDLSKNNDTTINKYIKLFTQNDSDGGEEITEQEAKILKAIAS